MLIGTFTGGVPTNILLIVFVNTLFVGISEELMMRGILLHGLDSKYSIVTSIILTSILFGIVHALNGLITGNFVGALIQAGLATLAGLWFGALRVRLTTIIPVMIIHALWDFAVFGSTQTGPDANPIFSILQFVFIPILVIYGIWLLRGIGKE